jgi:hypothetical protein
VRQELQLVQAFVAVRRNRPIVQLAAQRQRLAMQPVVGLEMPDLAKGHGHRGGFHEGRKCTGAVGNVHGQRPGGPRIIGPR